MTAANRVANRPKILLIVTSILFAMWIAAMLWMYFATVYPTRHSTIQPTTEPG